MPGRVLSTAAGKILCLPTLAFITTVGTNGEHDRSSMIAAWLTTPVVAVPAAVAGFVVVVPLLMSQLCRYASIPSLLLLLLPSSWAPS
jgi:hypothetical protein